jgi:rod shape-determining protein MreD
MARFRLQADQILLHQVIAFILLSFIAFVESSLGHISLLFGVAPKLTICLLFIFAIKFPHAVTLFTAVATGLVLDLAQGNPLGYTSSIFLIVFLVAEFRLNILKDAETSAIWLDFVLLFFGIVIYNMIIFGIYERQFPPFTETTLQFGLTILIFPILNWMVELYQNIGLFFEDRR